jgi:hypothetical protein
MNALITACKEIWGLFVEDGSYAAGIAIWLLLAIFVFPHLPQLGRYRSLLLVAGLLVLLLENIIRTARKSKARN